MEGLGLGLQDWFRGFRKKDAHSVLYVRNGFRKKTAHFGVVTNLDNFCDRMFYGLEVGVGDFRKKLVYFFNYGFCMGGFS